MKIIEKSNKISYCLAYRRQKPLITIRQCSHHVCFVSYSLCSYFFKYLYFLKKPNYHFHFIIFSQKCFYIALNTVFFLPSLHCTHSWWQCLITSFWFSQPAFLHIFYLPFLNIKCQWASLMCPIRSLRHLTSHCLQLL